MEGTEDGEEFISLSLSLAIDLKKTRKSKRKGDETPDHYTGSSESYYNNHENRLISLLQTRENFLTHGPKDIYIASTKERGLRLIRLLLISATSIDKNDTSSAVDNLRKLYQNVSVKGDAIQRVSAYFADALFARLLPPHSPLHEMMSESPNPDEEFLAFARLYKVSPFYQFAHFTANQAIFEAYLRAKSAANTENSNRVLHVIDFDVSYGFQWPSLMQQLSENGGNTNRAFLKITGYGNNSEELQETEARLASFAEGYPNLIFEFDGIVRGSNKLVGPKIKKSETVAVNLIISSLDSSNGFSDISSDTLKHIHSLSPSVVTLVEREDIRKIYTQSFLSLFAESLHHYAAVFDSLDECLPPDSVERLSIEKNHMGRQIKHMMSHYYYRDDDGDETTLKRRMDSHGFSGLEMSSVSLMQAKLLLRMRSCCYCSCLSFDNGDVNGGFRVLESDDGKAVSLAWQERTLVTVSSWCCV